MECYYHNGEQACGVCKSCQRGLCRSCAAEVSNGIACVGRCEERATELDRLVTRSTEMESTNVTLIKSISVFSAELFNLILGVLFLAFGFYKNIIFLQMLGGVFILFAAFGIYRVYRAKNKTSI